MNKRQIGLFEVVKEVYMTSNGALSNEQLYEKVKTKSEIEPGLFEVKTKIGKKGEEHCVIKRAVRWIQQTLKAAKVIEKVEGERGLWQKTESKGKLNEIKSGIILLGFCTSLGFAALCDSKELVSRLDEDADLYFSSPPYPLRVQRAYGNVDEQNYVDWLSGYIETAMGKIKPSGSILLNLGADIFKQGSPARSTYIERLIISLEDRFGLNLMDRFIWQNPNKAPGPLQWASLKRMQLNAGYEYVLWFAPNPLEVQADNRRVLMPNSEQHLKLMMNGGEKKARFNGDGNYLIREGSFGQITEGKIPRNVLEFSSVCKSQRDYQKYCKEIGLEKHGASMPLKLAEFFVKYMTAEGGMVVDMFAGSFTTGLACNLNGRRWIGCEKVCEYVFGAGSRFANLEGYEMNNALKNMFKA